MILFDNVFRLSCDVFVVVELFLLLFFLYVDSLIFVVSVVFRLRLWCCEIGNEFDMRIFIGFLFMDMWFMCVDVDFYC